MTASRSRQAACAAPGMSSGVPALATQTTGVSSRSIVSTGIRDSIGLEMAARLIDGKALAERIRGEIAEEVRELGEIGLATVLVGDDPASDIYIRLKHKASAEVGINARDIRLASETTEVELLEQVEQLNADDSIDGLLVQLPLP